MKGDGDDEMLVEGRFKRYKYTGTPDKLAISKPFNDDMTEEERLKTCHAILNWEAVKKIEFKSRSVINLDLTANRPPPLPPKKEENRYGFGSLDDRMYRPTSYKTKSAYWGLIIFIIPSLVAQRSHDTDTDTDTDADTESPLFVGDKIIEILKKDDVSDSDKKKEIELYLNSTTDSFFDELVSLVNLLTDYDEVVREIAAWKEVLD